VYNSIADAHQVGPPTGEPQTALFVEMPDVARAAPYCAARFGQIILCVVGGGGVATGFVELAPIVYADDRRWIPEASAVLAASFGSSNPSFYANRAITACLPGAVRLAGFYNPELRIEGRSVAFFRCFEACGSAEQDRQAFGARSLGARTGC
jgi:hypothetical protein